MIIQLTFRVVLMWGLKEIMYVKGIGRKPRSRSGGQECTMIRNPAARINTLGYGVREMNFFSVSF